MDIQAGYIAVITGAGGGLGSALARDLAERGCALALADISKEALQKTTSSLSSKAGKVTQHIVDVTDRKAMKKFRDDVLTGHGGVNILINNAGITLQKSFSTHSLEDWERIVGINLWGVIYGCHFFDEALTAAKQAHVINLSSMSAFLGLPGQSSYCATKAGVLWAEWSLKGIGLTSVHPGAIRTDMIIATLEESDDIEQAKKNYAIAHIEKNKMRLRIGKDAYIFHYISRFMPGLGNVIMKKIAAKLSG